MSLEFKLKDFAFPLSILELRSRFLKHPQLSANELEAYQLSRLHQIVEQAYQHVPFYRRVFEEQKIVPDDIQGLDDLHLLPCLTKECLRNNFAELTADNAKTFRPQLLCTSGTTGTPVKFYTDKTANVLEFVYYWRAWSWAGYKLGQRFAELSAEHFTSGAESKNNKLYRFEPLTRRLILNSLLLSQDFVEQYLSVLERFRPLYLKGLPTNLYILSLLLRERKNHQLRLRAVFSQGECLLDSHRKHIESTFQCKVFDSYGHLERTAAISQCSEGRYHLHPDYGLIELETVDYKDDESQSSPEQLREIVGTSLHNFAMPLIRYRTGDLIELYKDSALCPCGRTFPTIKKIIGRSSDVIITPDKRAVTAIYLIFDRTPGLLLGQIVQEELDRLIVKFSCKAEDKEEVQNCLLKNIREFVGSQMRIDLFPMNIEELHACRAGKFKNVVSKVPLEVIQS